MKEKLVQYLQDLRAYGIENDIPNITDEVGEFLSILVRLKKPRNILEIGCANGYSTIWLAEAAEKVGAKVHTIDHSRPTFAEAKKNLKEVGLAKIVEFYFGDAVKVISEMEKTLHFELVFVDGEKASYLNFWKVIEKRLAPGAVVVFDDMMAFPKKTKAFHDFIRTTKGVHQILIPIDGDDGILLVIKEKK